MLKLKEISYLCGRKRHADATGDALLWYTYIKF